jgi:hypothetical protein
MYRIIAMNGARSGLCVLRHCEQRAATAEAESALIKEKHSPPIYLISHLLCSFARKRA